MSSQAASALGATVQAFIPVPGVGALVATIYDVAENGDYRTFTVKPTQLTPPAMPSWGAAVDQLNAVVAKANVAGFNYPQALADWIGQLIDSSFTLPDDLYAPTTYQQVVEGTASSGGLTLNLGTTAYKTVTTQLSAGAAAILQQTLALAAQDAAQNAIPGSTLSAGTTGQTVEQSGAKLATPSVSDVSSGWVVWGVLIVIVMILIFMGA